MRVLPPAELMALWEHGAACHALDRCALLVAAARPALPPQAIADLPLGEVTDSLLGLRVANFGARLASHVDCTQCGLPLGFELELPALMRTPAEPAGPMHVDAAGLQLRAPSLRDLAAVADEHDAERAARRLLARCTLAGDAARADAAALAEIESALEALDPNADLLITLHCVHCGHEAGVQLDAGALLWDEIAARAQALLRDVHQLARAYGWAEAAILALSPARRASYLAMVAE